MILRDKKVSQIGTPERNSSATGSDLKEKPDRKGEMENVTKSDERLLACLQEGELRTSQLAAALQITNRAVTKHTVRLLREGLIEKPHQGHHLLTAAGRSYITEKLLAVEIDFGKVGKVIKKLPTEHHKAFLRLLLSAIVAKYHLFNTCDQGWPSFIAGGPTKTMKTAIGSLVCKLFGWDPGEYTKHVQISSQNELIGRRFWEGPGKYGFTPSPYFNRSFICLDELDKAEGGIRKRALYYLQGTTTVAVEGKGVENHPLPLVTLNTDSPEDFKILDSYLRRAVVLNTWPLRGELKDVDLIAERIFAGSIPRLNFDKLIPLKRKLSADESRNLRDPLEENLNDQGWGLTDLTPLRLLARGRTAFGATVTEAIYQTINDYLLCSETMNWTEKGWRGRVRPAWQQARGEAVEDSTTTVQQPPITAEPELETRVEKVKEGRFAQSDQVAEFKEERERVLNSFLLLRDRLNEIKGRCNKLVTGPLRTYIEHYIKHVGDTEIGHWDVLEHYDKKLQETRIRVDTVCEQYQQKQAQSTAEKRQNKARNAQINRIAHYQKRKVVKDDEDSIEIMISLGCVTRKTTTGKEKIQPGVGEWLTYGSKWLVDEFSQVPTETFSLSALQARVAEIEQKQRAAQYSLYDAEPTVEDLEELRKKQSILEGLRQRAPWVHATGDNVVVRKRDSCAPIPKPKTTTREYEYTYLLGIDGETYDDEPFRRWDEPWVQHQFQLRREQLEEQ